MSPLKNLLITGATGFIGGFLVEKAYKRGYRIWVSKRKSSNTQYIDHLPIKYINLNFDDKLVLKEQLSSMNFDYIIHNLGLTKTDKEELYNKINYKYLKTFVDALIELNKIPLKFIYTSSLASYGPADSSEQNIISEHMQPNPVTMYGRSKLKAEQYLKQKKNFPFLIYRPTAVYGPREKDLYTVFKTINSGLELYVGFLEQKLSFIHVFDLVDLLLDGLEHKKIQRAYFVSDGNTYTAQELNKFIKKALRKKTIKIRVPVSILTVFAYLNQIISKLIGNYPALNLDKINELKCQSWAVDSTTIVEDFNFAPQFSLEAGIKQTTEWYLEKLWLKKLNNVKRN